MERVCKQCHKIFYKPKNIGLPEFKTRQYCSLPCAKIASRKNICLTCPYCHKTLILNNKKKKNIYCSKECYWNARGGKTLTKICIICNKTFYRFKSSVAKGNYCSPSCAGKRFIPTIKICEICQKEFRADPGDIKRRFCTAECRNKHWSTERRQPDVNKLCARCGKKFTSRYKWRRIKCCSIACSKYLSGKNAGIARHNNPKYIFEHQLAIQRRKLYDKHKGHLRRTITRQSDITVEFLQQLWESTNICILCNEMMENHTNYPLGRHLDHIIPIKHTHPTIPKGTHTQNNVRYIHAVCNERRKRDLSDIPENFQKNFMAKLEGGYLFSPQVGLFSTET